MKKFSRIIYASFSVMLTFICLSASCRKDSEPKNQTLSTIVGTCILCQNNSCADQKKTTNCGDAFGFIVASPTGGQLIQLHGNFSDNTAILLSLLWNGNPTQTTFTLNEDKVGIGNWGYVSYSPKVGASPQYITIDGGTGTATVTNYDAVNNRISGTFSFKGKYFDGTAYKEVYRDFSGSFADIPIIDPNNPQLPCAVGSSGGTSGSGSNGTGSGTSTSSTITYTNASFTSINVTVNGVAKTIAPGSNVQYTGAPNTAATGMATTSGKTSSGTVVGSTYTWTLSNSFPASGTLNNTLNVSGDVFFLKVKNTSSKSITKVYVNYGLVNQTLDNITIANDGQTYNLGYYKAFSNSNVRGENGTTYWSWNTLSLPFTANQSVTVTAN